MAYERYRAGPPITFGQMRSYGVTHLLIYCCHGLCHHSAKMDGDRFPDALTVRALCPRMVCTKCGIIGADVRPDWTPHTRKQDAPPQRTQ